MSTIQYVGARYVPKFYEGSNGNQWEPNVTYEPLTIVTWLGSSWTSKNPVPADAGAPNLAPAYWVNTGNFSAQIEAFQQAMTQIQEDVDLIKYNYPEVVTALDAFTPVTGQPVLYQDNNPYVRWYTAGTDYSLKDYETDGNMYLVPVVTPDPEYRYLYEHKDVTLTELPDGYYLQGACESLDGTQYVITFANSTFSDVKIFKINKDLTSPDFMGSFQYGHSNDLCNDGEFYYLVTLDSGVYANSILKLDAYMNLVDRYTVGYRTLAITYTGEEFIVLGNDSQTDTVPFLCVYDSSFTELRRTYLPVNPYSGISATDGGLEFDRNRKTLFWNAAVKSAGDGTNPTWPYSMISELDTYGKLLRFHYIPTMSPQHEPENIIYDNGRFVLIGRRGINYSKVTYGTDLPRWNDFVNPFEIMVGDDLNDYIVPGRYVCHSSVVAGQVTNGPFDNTNYLLEVEYLGNGNYRQKGCFVRDTGDVVTRIRTYYGAASTWSAWNYDLMLTQILGHTAVSLDASEQKNVRINLPTLGNTSSSDYTFTYSIAGPYAADAVSSIVYGKATGYVDLRLKNNTESALTLTVDWTAVCRPLL